MEIRAEFDACPVMGEAFAYTVEERFLPMPDGVKLHTTIYKPVGKGTFPVLIQRSCYPSQMEIYKVYGEELARRGYGYVLQVCRGTGRSEGEWEPNVNERGDGLAALGWLNDQEWAESIGCFGASYLALTGWAIADAVPEKVKGMMLTVYGTDRFKSAYEKRLFRHDVVSFVSRPLIEKLEIAGRIKVRLQVKTDVEDTAFSAKLCEVFPDGRAYNIRSGITTIAADLPEGADYIPGEQTEVSVDFWDIVWTIQPGSCLRLDISSSDFPQYAAHSNYAGIWSDQEKSRIARQVICTGSGECCLELPVAAAMEQTVLP